MMTKDLLVRGFDDQIHSELSNISEKMGVSLNSIVKDAVDKWLESYSQIPKKHDLLMYADNESLLHLLKTMDGIAKDVGWFRCFCSRPDHPATKLLNRLNWFDVTASAYNMTPKNIRKFFSTVIGNALKAAKGKPLCFFDFIIEDYFNISLKDAIALEAAYNSKKLDGVLFCPYRLASVGQKIIHLFDLFDAHDQAFVVQGTNVYKLHSTKENAHKLFLK